MRRSTLLTALVAGVAAAMLITGAPPRALAHCEIPCGIYDDHARITLMLEDTTTIALAIDQITMLAGKPDPTSLNQLTRWTANKELHATRIQETIAQYFLTQRVKPARQGTQAFNDYVMRLVQHHAVLVAAMKAKQSADPGRAEQLREAIETISVYYPPTQPTTAPGR